MPTRPKLVEKIKSLFKFPWEARAPAEFQKEGKIHSDRHKKTGRAAQDHDATGIKYTCKVGGKSAVGGARRMLRIKVW